LFREGVDTLLVCLTPIAPHICEELWEITGKKTLISLEEWPVIESEALVADTVTIVFQVNGKVREQFELPAGMDPEEMKKEILSRPEVKSRLEGKEILRVIPVPDRLVNVVVKNR
jgi:leucyl-tRNA synthetase